MLLFQKPFALPGARTWDAKGLFCLSPSSWPVCSSFSRASPTSPTRADPTPPAYPRSPARGRHPTRARPGGRLQSIKDPAWPACSSRPCAPRKRPRRIVSSPASRPAKRYPPARRASPGPRGSVHRFRPALLPASPPFSRDRSSADPPLDRSRSPCSPIAGRNPGVNAAHPPAPRHDSCEEPGTEAGPPPEAQNLHPVVLGLKPPSPCSGLVLNVHHPCRRRRNHDAKRSAAAHHGLERLRPGVARRGWGGATRTSMASRPRRPVPGALPGSPMRRPSSSRRGEPGCGVDSG